MEGTAIVTGAGSGLGRHVALGLARAGFGVVVAEVDPTAAAECADRIEALGRPARVVAADVRERAGLDRIVAAADELGGPRVLVNNAGGWTPHRQYPSATPEEWTATIALNLTAPMLLSQLVLELMRARGGGAIVNVASSAGVGLGAYGSPEYGAAKAGLIRFTTSCAGLVDTHGVRMMAVVPGWIGLDRAHAEWERLDPAERARLGPLIPPGEVVAAILDLVRDGAAGAVVEMLRPAGGQRRSE